MSKTRMFWLAIAEVDDDAELDKDRDREEETYHKPHVDGLLRQKNLSLKSSYQIRVNIIA